MKPFLMRTRLDSLRAHFYKARPLLAVGCLVVSGFAGAEVVEGVQLPDNARKVGEHRYRAPSNFDTTMTYYRAVYRPETHPRRTIANQPGIKAIHISNPGGKDFEGLNIYEANDEVRIYIVPAGSGKPAKKSDSKGLKKKSK